MGLPVDDFGTPATELPVRIIHKLQRTFPDFSYKLQESNYNASFCQSKSEREVSYILENVDNALEVFLTHCNCRDRIKHLQKFSGADLQNRFDELMTESYSYERARKAIAIFAACDQINVKDKELFSNYGFRFLFDDYEKESRDMGYYITPDYVKGKGSEILNNPVACKRVEQLLPENFEQDEEFLRRVYDRMHTNPTMRKVLKKHFPNSHLGAIWVTRFDEQGQSISGWEEPE